MSDKKTHLRQNTYLAVVKLAELMACETERLLAADKLTGPQYNILRILRGAKGEALHCGEVGRRMLTPVPDLTRVLDKLEKRGFVERHRDAADRRVVRVSLTPAGGRLVNKLDIPVEQLHENQLSMLTDRQVEQLLKLCKAAVAR